MKWQKRLKERCKNVTFKVFIVREGGRERG